MRAASRLRTATTLLGALVAVAMAAGLLLAGIALPAVGAMGATTNQSINLFNTMPSDFAMNPLTRPTRILAADGSVIATPFDSNRIDVPLSQIAPVMQHAQVAIEDARYYQHGAVDPHGLLRAIAHDTLGSGSTQGASTIVEQYVKIAMQDRALAADNQKAAKHAVAHAGMQAYVRKLQQLRYAVTLTQKYSKNAILDGYLNIVYFGDQQYGIEAASRHYFGVHASQLDLPQAALLAGVVNEPSAYDPAVHPKASIRRRNLVLLKMRQQKMITPAQYTKAVHTKLQLHLTQVSNSCASSKYPYFCYYVQAWLLQQPSLGKTPQERAATLQLGGLTVQTGFNTKIANNMKAKIDAKIPPGNPSDVQSAGVMVQPGTGVVVASAQNTAYSNQGGPGKTSINYTTPAALGGGQGFDFGSAAKMFAVVTALKQGRPGNFTINVPPASGTDKLGQFHDYTNADIPGRCGLLPGQVWKVHNDNPVPAGPMSVDRALGQSVNTAFAKLVGSLGVCNVRQTMIDFGMQQGNGTPLDSTPSGITLGTNAVAPVTLANAYATIAAGGVSCQPHPVTGITTSAGKKLKLTGTGCKRIISTKIAAQTTKILKSVFLPGSTAGPANKLSGGRPAAGKTGTVTGATQTWFVGFTPQLTTAMWVGHANTAQPLKDVTLAGKFYKGYVFGATLSAPLWKSVMDDALKGKPIKQFPKP